MLTPQAAASTPLVQLSQREHARVSGTPLRTRVPSSSFCGSRHATRSLSRMQTAAHMRIAAATYVLQAVCQTVGQWPCNNNKNHSGLHSIRHHIHACHSCHIPTQPQSHSPTHSIQHTRTHAHNCCALACRCGSSTGDFVIHARKSWAPIGFVVPMHLHITQHTLWACGLVVF
jgi:hypothetical protein